MADVGSEANTMMVSDKRLPVTSGVHQVSVISLSGPLDADSCVPLMRSLRKGRSNRTERQGQPLILDMAGVPLISASACRTLQRAIERDHAPLLVIAAPPRVRRALDHHEITGMRQYRTLAEALAALSAPGDMLTTDRIPPAAEPEEPEVLHEQMLDLQAKARTSGMIGVAQGILLTRYGLSKPSAALDLLKETSQHFNVPLRVLASAVITAPPPRHADQWFFGRTTRTAPPVAGFLRAHRVKPSQRRQVLIATISKAVTVTDADAAELHLKDAAQDDVLVLEQHQGLDAAYRDQAALVAGPPAVCARVQQRLEPVTVPDVATDAALSTHPVGRALLEAGTRAVHGLPLITPDGHCTGTLTVHRSQPGTWLSGSQQQTLGVLAVEVASWSSWYRRTIIVDALEHLHQHRTHRPATR
ncbi:ANTAR domain-containing protein [Streptomyces sp. NPDC101171]|uniref:ANTAR domain-containing protein n=1 Tax=Streptomyces sp. NPDC101171 TaxID=3366122 RepID=UPI003800260C